ncbi:four-carbon acid sugar kinase family protein [Portibacter marinus]|uniref:four-carbon acid sugar kinase family protein n=1 Tax=Portibacter marinus TaxID=2898660 RepID=UPI001F25D674|nr:four-carbon acid sugar kinase family protein [Portibacter marinus]
MEALLSSIKEGKKLPNLYLEIRDHLVHSKTKVIVIDDDPTGCQTVYDVPLMTIYSREALQAFIHSDRSVLFILTNSRSKNGKEAFAINKKIKNDVETVSFEEGLQILYISRSDSTLRGHFKDEVNALKDPHQKCLFIPAFFEGGRYTFENQHYVREGNTFQKACETPFAKDQSFGYESSYLPTYISEKLGEQVEVDFLSIDEIRNTTVTALAEKINDSSSEFIVVNAAAYIDLQRIALASLKAKNKLLYRSSASFVNALGGIKPRSPLDIQDLRIDGHFPGLIIIGSYVPKTTRQLQQLRMLNGLKFIEMPTEALLSHKGILSIREEANHHLGNGNTTVLYTSRTAVDSNDKQEALEIVNQVAAGVVKVGQGLRLSISYLIAKGGITSNDVATEVLRIKQTKVLGQAMAGVPVWETSDFPFIVFPGNVGDDMTLYELVKKLEK